MSETQEVFQWSAALGSLLPVVVGGLLATVGAVVNGLITSQIQDRRIKYDESVRIDKIRRDQHSRFDHVRREVYGRFVGAARRLSMDSGLLIAEADPHQTASLRSRSLETYEEVGNFHGEVAIIGTGEVVSKAHGLLDVVTRLSGAALSVTKPLNENEVTEFKELARQVDAAQQEFTNAVRTELRIAELESDPVFEDSPLP